MLGELAVEIEADRSTLRQVMVRLGVGESRAKLAAGWLGEKLGRLKLNGQLRGYSDLSRVVELEGLCLGVNGKLALWEALGRTAGPELPEFDFPALSERARDQLRRLEAERLAAARLAFGGAPPRRS